MLSVTLEGPPVIQERHRIRKWGGMYDPTSKAKKTLAQTLLVARQTHGMALLTGECKVEAYFYDAPHKRGQKPDIDNFLKALFDAGNGVLWKDDSQIVRLTTSVERNSVNPRTELTVTDLSVTRA